MTNDQNKQNIEKMTDTSRTEVMQVRESRCSVKINASPSRVWKALTEDFGKWWPRDLVVGPAIKFNFEPYVGGRLWEDYGDKGGLEWALVKAIQKEEKIILTTDVFPDMGGPARSIMEYHLEKDGNGTLLIWSETRFGRIDDSIPMGQWRPPWQSSLENRLKPYVEGEILDSPSVEEDPR